MIKLIKTIAGHKAETIKQYPESWSMEDASKEFTKGYEDALNERCNVNYIISIQNELTLLNEGLDPVEDAEQIESNMNYIISLDFEGQGYYTNDGDCLLLKDELKTSISEDSTIWELVETPDKETPDNEIDEIDLMEQEHFIYIISGDVKGDVYFWTSIAGYVNSQMDVETVMTTIVKGKYRIQQGGTLKLAVNTIQVEKINAIVVGDYDKYCSESEIDKFAEEFGLPKLWSDKEKILMVAKMENS